MNEVLLSLSVSAVLGLAATAIALWPTEQHPVTAPKYAVPAVSREHSLPGSPSKISAAQDLPMRFTNPFDASEVFEFAPGTTEDAARESVAEVLLERARERRAQVGKVSGARSRFASRNTSTTYRSNL